MKISRTIAEVVIIIFILSHLVPGYTYADEKALTLREALEYAMKENPGIRAMEKTLLAANEDIGIARSYLLPRVTLEERLMRTSTPAYAFSFKMNQERFSVSDLLGAPDTFNNPVPINDFQTTLSFEQPLFAPKAYVGIDMARKESAAMEKEFGRKKEDVALRVFRTYLGVETSKAHVAAADKGIEDAEAHLRSAEIRYKEGLGIYSDVLRAKVALSAATERRVLAIRDLNVSKRALGLFLGMTESVDIVYDSASPEVKDIDYYYGASVSRKDLKAMEGRVRNAENMVRLADAGLFPTFGIGGAYQMNDHSRPLGPDGNSWQLMAFMRWEIFDGTKRMHERQKARYKTGEAEEYLSGMKKEIAFNIYDAYLGVDAARESLALAKAAFLSAEEGVRIVKLRYENSLSSMTELLDMQSALDSSRAGVVEKESAYRAAAADLWFQSGNILRELGFDDQEAKE